ncbi:cation transporter [Maritalea sp.]|jgi:mercuric ion binding protein|uniref:cation transporter n=1 Tax=Maritalea sp. TaxID=2003361 RepID=UPI0039E5FDCB
MKKILMIALFGFIAPFSSSFAAEQTVQLSVPGMTCASCPFIVKGAISRLDGIIDVQTSLEDLSAIVVFEDTLTSIQDIINSTVSVGYESSVVDPA